MQAKHVDFLTGAMVTFISQLINSEQEIKNLRVLILGFLILVKASGSSKKILKTLFTPESTLKLCRNGTFAKKAHEN